MISQNPILTREVGVACRLSGLNLAGSSTEADFDGAQLPVVPDLIILDVANGVVNLAPLVKRVAALAGDGFIPTIAVTPDDTPTRVKVLREGAHECISWPFHSEELSARMVALLRLKSLQDKMIEQDDLLRVGNQELVRLSTLKDEFIASLSHELRTPLTSICEFTSLVLDEVPGAINEDQRECLEIAQANCQHLSMMIDDLLNLSRIVTGEAVLEAAPSNLVMLGKKALQSLSSTASQRQVRLEFESDLSALPVVLDRGRMRQVIVNLVSNAIKFTPEGTLVRMVVERDEAVGVARVHVIDEGPGLSPEQQKQVFGRFYQAEPAWISKSGLGLGLTVCMEIMSLHGGRIGVESTPEVGCRFFLELPLDGDMASPGPDNVALSPDGQSTQGSKAVDSL
jgi:signal transduction histidine kinase